MQHQKNQRNYKNQRYNTMKMKEFSYWVPVIMIALTLLVTVATKLNDLAHVEVKLEEIHKIVQCTGDKLTNIDNRVTTLETQVVYIAPKK